LSWEKEKEKQKNDEKRREDFKYFHTSIVDQKGKEKQERNLKKDDNRWLKVENGR